MAGKGTGPNQTDASVGHYAVGALATAAAAVLSAGGGLAAALIANRLLGKEGFAAYSVAAVVVFMVALIGSAGLDKRILYVTSRSTDPPGQPRGGAQAAGMLATAAVGALLVGALVLAGSGWLERAMALPDLRSLLQVMLFGAPMLAAIWVLSEWRRGAMMLAGAALIPALIDPARAVLLAVALWAAAGVAGAGLASVAALALPLALLVARMPAGDLRAARLPSRDDLGYGLRMLLGRLTKESANRLDLVIVAFVAPAAAVAEYAVAARIAMLLMTAQVMTANALGPRIAALGKAGDRATLVREYGCARNVATILALAGATLIAALGGPVLALFGDYAAARPVLLILSAAFLIDVSFGPGILLLGMLGRAGAALGLRLFGLAALIGMILLLAPSYGATGTAIAAMLAMLVLNLGLWVIVGRLEAIVLVRPFDFAPAAIGAALLLAGAGGLPPVPVAAGLGGVCAFALWRDRACWRPLSARVSGMATEFFRRNGGKN